MSFRYFCMLKRILVPSHTAFTKGLLALKWFILCFESWSTKLISRLSLITKWSFIENSEQQQRLPELVKCSAKKYRWSPALIFILGLLVFHILNNLSSSSVRGGYCVLMQDRYSGGSVSGRLVFPLQFGVFFYLWNQVKAVHYRKNPTIQADKSEVILIQILF